MRLAINPYGTIGFGLASTYAVLGSWSLPEFCWSTWLAGLVYAWGCIATASVQGVLTACFHRAAIQKRIPFLRHLSPAVFLLGAILFSLSLGWLAFRLYSFLFGFYGLFLSVFAELEPHSLFGRNGFINSDFFTPVLFLLERFWPMVVGVLIANWQDFLGGSPWQRIRLPLQREIIRLHVMILALPFFALLAWALFGAAYQPFTILLLMALLYLLPKPSPARQDQEGENADLALRSPGPASRRYK